MNITDIDDKIINKAIKQQRDFLEISRHFENEFMDDMRRLNVGLPDVITRVSEYVPEIVEFIQGIMKNGFAYESNGSVYFDVTKYNADPNHTYAKLEPTSVDNKELMQEGEGILACAETEKEKRNEKDFALWKKSKEGEPKWQSPWGEGRPGWHIECSAMCASILKGFPIDIHSGGIDLRFPHHDNELAQSEAYYNCDNWVNNFWHAGHLHIHGKKMSKSLKNFITIKDILAKHNARQIRYVFLLHNWNSLMNYTTEKTFPEAVGKDRQFTEFFRSVKALTRNIEIGKTTQRWEKVDFDLSEALLRTKKAVHEALCDSFDTPTAVEELGKLVVIANTYLQQSNIKIPLVRQVSGYVFKILKAFGVYEEDDVPNLASADGQSTNIEEAITPLMNALSLYRDQVKATADKGPKEIYILNDKFRDEVLPDLGIKLEDRKPGEPSIWKFVDKETLLKEREDKIAAKLKKEQEKQERAALELKKKSTPPTEWFKVFRADEFSAFDEQGLPTHNKAGKELSEAIRNKLKKEWTKQEQVFQQWQQSQAGQKVE